MGNLQFQKISGRCWLLGCLSKWLGSCRIINGCPESGNSDPTGMAALSFLYSMCIKDVLYQVFGMTDN